MAEITVRAVVDEDHKYVLPILNTRWGGPQIIVSRVKYQADKLPGLIAFIGDEFAGLLTYIIKNHQIVIVTLDSQIQNLGVATKLILHITEYAKKHKFSEIILITTNDNIKALEFYQKRGFQIIKVIPNAIEISRKFKPSIPLIADNGIPIRDEILLMYKI